MSDGFQILLDAPGDVASTLQIAALGSYKHSGYGDFSIAEDDVKQWQTNLSQLPGGRAPIDLDHRSSRAPRNTEAAGWITKIHDPIDGKATADVEWTSLGKQAITDKRYLFFSPTYGPFKTATGEVFDNTLCGGALTNQPFMTSMPTITLAAPDRVATAYDRVIGDMRLEADASADSQRSMATEPVNTELLKLLDLPEDADEAKILETITALKTTAPVEGEAIKTLEQAADEAGKVMLDKPALDALVANAQLGLGAHNKLLEMEFDTAFDKAVREGRATPAMRDSRKHFFTLDKDATLKELEDGPVIVNTQATPWDNTRLLHADPDAVPIGVHPSSHTMHVQVMKTLEAENLPPSKYTEVFNRLMEAGV